MAHCYRDCIIFFVFLASSLFLESLDVAGGRPRDTRYVVENIIQSSIYSTYPRLNNFSFIISYLHHECDGSARRMASSFWTKETSLRSGSHSHNLRVQSNISRKTTQKTPRNGM